MISTSLLLTIKASSYVVVEKLTNVFREFGLQVIQSFDLQTAISAYSGCTCPHHGSEICDCQMIMLILYSDEGEPIRLIVHGKDGTTHLGVIDNPQMRGLEKIDYLIKRTFSSNQFEIIRTNLWMDAT
jgi:hypothetical protein